MAHRRVKTFGFGRRSRRSFGHGYEPARSCRYEPAIFRRCGFRPRQWLCCFRLSGSSGFSQNFRAKSRHGQPLSLGKGLPSTLQRRRPHLPHPSEGQHGLGQWFYRARKSSCLGKSFKQEAHSCYPGRSVGCGLEFIAGHHRTTDPVDVEAGCHGEAGGKPADRCSSFSAPWEWEVINEHFVPLAGGSPYTPAPFSFLPAFFLVVVHLKHQLISSPFLLSFSWWWFTLKDQLLSSTFLLSSSWWWFTLNTNSFLLLFCFLLLGGGSP